MWLQYYSWQATCFTKQLFPSKDHTDGWLNRCTVRGMNNKVKLKRFYKVFEEITMYMLQSCQMRCINNETRVLQKMQRTLDMVVA